jgi:hypothetical protein
MAGGRPAMFEKAEDMQKAVDDYLTTNNTPTISGLAYYLGFESRQSFYDYEQREEFSYTIKRCRLFMESHYEARLQGNNPAGSIFWLKNAGWTDKTEVDQKTEHSGSIQHTIDHSKLSDAALREIAALDKPKESKD